jgi:hypothetical protein
MFAGKQALSGFDLLSLHSEQAEAPPLVALAPAAGSSKAEA